MSRTGMIRSTGVIGIATAFSRALGFLRDVVMAGFFGTSMEAQAFVVAFRIPNSLRDMVGEGAANAAVVPVLAEYRALKDEREFLRVSRILFNIAFAALAVLTLAGIIFSPAIVRLMAPGFINDPDKLALTVRLNRFIFPYLILIGLTAYSMGVLNAVRHFAAPAFGPALLNLALILAAIWLCPRMGAMGLVIGVLIGGALQLFLNIPVMYAKGITLSFADGFRHSAVKKIGLLLAPRVLGAGVYQINIFVDTILASFATIVGEGGVAALYYANRLIQFPLAIFGLALAQAALPKMSDEYSRNDIAGLRGTLSFGLRVMSLIMLPAGFGLAVLGGQIVRILFQRGEFTGYSTFITNDALFFYSFGLFAYSGIKLLVSCFYSMQDTMTPVKTAAASVALNVILNLILMWPLKLGGLALATSISATANFIMLYLILRKRIGGLDTKGLLGCVLKGLSASAVMAAALTVSLKLIGDPNPLGLFALVAAAAAVFLIAGCAFGIKEIRDIPVWILRKR